MGNGIWSYTVDPSRYQNKTGVFMSSVTAYDANGNATAQLSLPNINVGVTSHSYSIVQYGTSGSGQKLVYYDIKPTNNSPNTKKLLAGFEIHGWEDNYAKDGQVLVDIGNSIADYFAENKTDLSNFELIVIPSMNPDGLYYGATNNGKGRCQTSLGIDINRDFDYYFTSSSTPRNLTLTTAFSSPESRALRDLVSSLRPNIVLDFHGWLNETIGDTALASIVSSEMGLPFYQNFNSSYSGYFAAWAKNYAERTLLVEYPTSCANGEKEAYVQKTQNTLVSIMSTYSVKGSSPIITIDPYNNLPTEGSINVTARTDKGTLNCTSHTFTENGSFDFVATDYSDNIPNITTVTVTISNIVDLPPIINGVENNGAYNHGVIVTFNDGIATLNGKPFQNNSQINATGVYDLKVMDSTNNMTECNFTVVILGDVNGDGKMDVMDLTAMKAHLLKTSQLNDVYKKAGDIFNCGEITISSLLAVKKNLLGIYQFPNY